MMNEVVSIIVPVYNTALYLEQFFSALKHQTFQEFKAYIVYDISTDGSLDILRKYELEDPVHYEILYSPKKDGLGAARDYALNSKKIIGKYVLFLDPDDYPELNFLEKMVNAAEISGADIIVCGFERFQDETGEVLCTEMVHNPEESITDIKSFDLLAYMNPVVWDKMYRREVIDDLRFTNVKRTEDVFWLIRMIPHIGSMKFINEVLYHYRVREGSLLNSIDEEDYNAVVENFVQVKKEHLQEYGENSPYLDIIDLIIFFRCGIGITYRTAINNMKKASWYSKRTKRVMDEYFSGWRKNKYLKLSYCKKRGFKGIAIWGCKILYIINAFPLYIYCYEMFKKILKVEVKW